jgi:hypothetical protein
MNPGPILRWAILVVFSLATQTALASCGSPQRPEIPALVTLGAALNGVAQENRAIYVRETNAAIERLHAQDAGVAAYDLQNQGRVQKYEDRSQAIESLDQDLYTAAAIADSIRHGGDARLFASAARHLLADLQSKLEILRDGTILPAMTIPPEFDDVIGVLQAIISAEANNVH